MCVCDAAIIQGMLISVLDVLLESVLNCLVSSSSSMFPVQGLGVRPKLLVMGIKKSSGRISTIHFY